MEVSQIGVDDLALAPFKPTIKIGEELNDPVKFLSFLCKLIEYGCRCTSYDQLNSILLAPL